MKNLPKTIAYKGCNIPTGKTPEDIAVRRKIITDFYKQWFGENQEKKVENRHLKDFILVNHLSIAETKFWAGYSYQSTLTVLNLTYILRNAVRTSKRKDEKPKPDNKNQKKFERVITMECIVPEIRPYVNIAKLTVGVYKVSQNKIQYCLTAK
jgi:hypothetical protein